MLSPIKYALTALVNQVWAYRVSFVVQRLVPLFLLWQQEHSAVVLRFTFVALVDCLPDVVPNIRRIVPIKKNNRLMLKLNCSLHLLG